MATTVKGRDKVGVEITSTQAKALASYLSPEVSKSLFKNRFPGSVSPRTFSLLLSRGLIVFDKGRVKVTILGIQVLCDNLDLLPKEVSLKVKILVDRLWGLP